MKFLSTGAICNVPATSASIIVNGGTSATTFTGGPWSPTTASTVTIGDSTNAPFTASTTAATQASDCFPVKFANTTLNTADQLMFTVNGVLHTTTQTGATSVPTTCYNYTGGAGTGAAATTGSGGIVSEFLIASTPTAAVPIANAGFYLVRLRDTLLNNDLPVAVLWIYNQVVVD